MKRRTTSLAAGAFAFAALAAPAGASQYPYAGLGECSPDVTDTTITPTSASLTFTVPDGCAPQNWLLIVEDYRRNGGSALPADGRTRLVEDRVTALPGQPVEWTWSSPSRLCGGQVDLVLEGQEQPYAAAVFEMDGCEDVVGTTATPPPAPDNTTPPEESAASVAGVTDGGGGTGNDIAATPATTAGPAPLVQIATQPRMGTLPATLPETGGFSGQLLVIGLIALGAGVLAMVGAALEGRFPRGRKAGR